MHYDTQRDAAEKRRRALLPPPYAIRAASASLLRAAMPAADTVTPSHADTSLIRYAPPVCFTGMPCRLLFYAPRCYYLLR